MNGIILINKPKDYTSHDIVSIAKKSLKEKMGHTGTLDPNATGVLPLLIGDATKISKYLINHDKIYIATLKLGIKTDTLDSTGKILEETKVDTNDLKKRVQNVLNQFIGKCEQYPPMYSAIKVNGKKLYEYARSNKQVEIQPRKIHIYNIELLEVDEKNKEIRYKVECSKGTYIRTLCEDIANKLGTIGIMKELQRIKVGEFEINNTVTVEELKRYEEDKEKIENKIITIEQIFKNKEKIELDNKQLQLFLNGVKLTMNLKDDIYRVYNNSKFIGLGIVNKNLLKRDVIIKED